MTTNVELSNHTTYLCVRVRGMLDWPAAREVVRKIAAALEPKASSVLLDVRNAECKLSYVDISGLFTEVESTVFSQKIAVLHQKNDKKDTADFLKLYAVNRGFLVQTFLDEDAAQQWLSESLK